MFYEFRFQFYEYFDGKNGGNIVEKSERFQSLKEARKFRKKFRNAKNKEKDSEFLEENYGRYGLLKKEIGIFEITERKLDDIKRVYKE